MWIERLMAGISHQHVLSYNPYFCALLAATIQYHLRRDPVLLKIFRNKSWRFSEWSSCGDRKHYAKKSCIP